MDIRYGGAHLDATFTNYNTVLVEHSPPKHKEIVRTLAVIHQQAESVKSQS